MKIDRAHCIKYSDSETDFFLLFRGNEEEKPGQYVRQELNVNLVFYKSFVNGGKDKETIHLEV